MSYDGAAISSSLLQVTGYYSGSVYKDYALMKNGFPAESVSNGSVVVVKTHEWGPEVSGECLDSILRLVDVERQKIGGVNEKKCSLYLLRDTHRQIDRKT